jgi:hypothetical protein
MIEANLSLQPQQVGHTVWPKTYEIFPYEKALLLIERNENRPDYQGFHRYQTIFVLRNDNLAKYMEDMGPAELFLASEFDIPGGDPGKPRSEWQETVSALRDYADDFRQWLAMRQYEREMPDLIEGYHDQIDKEARIMKHQSNFGPLCKVERG